MSFPRRYAVTRRFTLGSPRTPTVTAEGRRVLFLRSDAGDDPVHSLWSCDLPADDVEPSVAPVERRVLDPRTLDIGGDGELPLEERARRERARETGEGVVAYDVDDAGARAVAALGGHLVLVDLDPEAADAPRILDAAPGAYDPRIDPTGERIAYVAAGALRVVGPDEADRVLVNDPDVDVTWGAADFIASEELSRTRGHWWSPDGRRLVVERVDTSPVDRWHIASPAEPWTAPQVVRYPAAGTANARCALAVVGIDGSWVEVDWDGDAFPYLADVSWPAEGPLLVTVLDRPQRTMLVLSVDPDTGATTERHRQEDPAWVEVVPGSPRWWDGHLLTVEDRDEARRLCIDGEPLSPPEWQVRSIVGTDGDAERGVVWVTASSDPTEVHVLTVSSTGEVVDHTPSPGVHGMATADGTAVLVTSAMEGPPTMQVRRDPAGASRVLATLGTVAEEPDVTPAVRFLELGERRLRAALLLPTGDDGAGPLPILLDPYGGPHAQRVLRSRNGFLTSQWLADQGFAVLVVDGRGTPGRGPAWEREVRGDLAGPVLDDQVDALAAAAEVEPRLDLTRVGIRGWSFGGYLAALAVLRRPDVFHAAVAGAPVTDWRLYDTAYTERYLGHPDEDPESYARSSLAPFAADLDRPLMLIHGLADDNVVVAHTLELSRALLEAGRPHTVLPLSGVTHMTPQEAVAENLLRLQVRFLREALG